jgi:NAD+ synthase (glutamine-hydrolysing)
MKIALAQISPTVGDLENNSRKILEYGLKAAKAGADLVVFSELSLLGYPPKDLVRRQDFLDQAFIFLKKIAAATPLPTIVGTALKREGYRLPFNAAVLCHQNETMVIGKKRLLPNYNVFDEKRYFSTPYNTACDVFSILGKKILLSICEDAWNSFPVQDIFYDFDPIKNALAEHGAVDLIINIAASPFSKNKPATREKLFTSIAKTYETPVLVCGQVGANDQLLFDGHSMIIDNKGRAIKRAQFCTEDLIFFNGDNNLTKEPAPTDAKLLLEVLTMGIKEYVAKCHLPGVIVGLSGGIDSAVVAALAVRALGHEKVRALYLPSRFSSEQSFLDAKALAHNLSIRLDTFAIEDSAQLLRTLLAKELQASSKTNRDIADQNIQARLRGLIIMEISNTTDAIMLTTSNKSELAVGYSTTYGDMCGAFSVIGDLYKTEVYQLAHTINEEQPLILESIIKRPPTAELKPNQFDTDTLPDYAVLDQILFNFIELEKSAAEIHKITALPRDLIDHIIGMVNRAEYKRRQAPFSLMVSNKVFGDARRLPIAKRMPKLS